MIRVRWIRTALLLCATLGPAKEAMAIAECTVSTSPVSFGNYDPFSSSPLDVAGNVRVSCSLLGLISLLVNYDILLSTGSAGNYSRNMYSGANALPYNLYTTSGRTTVWGDGTGGTSFINDGYLLGLLTVTRDYPVYGRIPARQDVPADSYSDTITVTVNY